MTEIEPPLEPIRPKTVAGKGYFLRDVVKLLTGTTAAQIITILTAPLISRLFDPRAFGTLAIFVSLISIVGVIVCLRYEQAILLPERDEEAVNIFALSLFITLVISSIGLVIVFSGRKWLPALLNAPELTPFLWLIPLSLLIQGIVYSFTNWHSRQKRFGHLSAARVSASFTTSAMPITLSFLHLNSASVLITSWASGLLVTVSLLIQQVWTKDRLFLRQHISWSGMKQGLVRYRKFPLVDVWGAFLNNLSWQLPSLMLSAYFSGEIVGFYSLSNRMILLPMTLVGGAVSQVFFQRTAELRYDPEQLRITVEMVFRRLVALGLMPIIVLILNGQTLFRLIFGSQWAEAGVYAEILGAWLFFLFISSPMSTLFFVMEKQEQAFVLHLLILCSRLAALIIGGRTQNIYLTLGLWSGSGVFIYGGLTLWLLWVAGSSWRFAAAVMLRYGFYALPLTILLFLSSRYLTHQIFLNLALLLILTGVYYLLVLHQEPALRQLMMNWLRQRLPQLRK
ncbi:MAG: oligosaccharide flippase family protein [Chloroflexi bacterium]|nr:oligosaccharide flippase family protein [Chloroflexota bacterium]MBP8055795.1 oligosaccharide flippase family protein [Chloroflexota bacterium]